MLDAGNQNRTMFGMEAKKMTREQIEMYRASWSAVKTLETEEAKNLSYEQRWTELNSLFNIAYELGLIYEPPEAEMDAIRARWVKLKAAYL